VTNTPVVCRGYLSVPPGRLSQSPGKDVAGRVDVGVGLVSADDAPKHRLALTAIPGDVPTETAGLRRIRGVDLDDHSAGEPGLVVQGHLELTPTFAKDGTVQPALLSDVASRLISSARCTGSQVPDVQRFDSYHRLIAAVLVGQLLIKVATTSSDPCPQPSQVSLCIFRTSRGLGAALSSTQVLPRCALLQSQHSPLLTGGHEHPIMQPAIGVRDCDLDTSIDANGSLCVLMLGRGSSAVVGENRNPPVPSIETDRHRSHFSLDRAGPAQPHPAEFRQPHLTDLAAQAPYRQERSTLRQPHRRTPSRLRPPSHLPRPMIPASSIEVNQRLLQHVRRGLCQPGQGRLCLGQFFRLSHVIRPGTAPPVFLPLLQSGVPNRSAYTSPRLQRTGLLCGRSKPVPKSSQHDLHRRQEVRHIMTESNLRQTAAFPLAPDGGHCWVLLS
jgi:hypothetical protein